METAELFLNNDVKNIFVHPDISERIAAFNEAWAKIINEQENARELYKPVSGN